MTKNWLLSFKPPEADQKYSPLGQGISLCGKGEEELCGEKLKCGDKWFRGTQAKKYIIPSEPKHAYCYRHGEVNDKAYDVIDRSDESIETVDLFGQHINYTMLTSCTDPTDGTPGRGQYFAELNYWIK